jgi:IS5 family transposase
MSIKLSERQLPMFEMIFSDYLNPDHELLRAAKLIDWDGLHEAFRTYYSRRGRAGKPIRLMVGIHILKHRYNTSDERAVEELQENVYWQYFCGFKTFQKGDILDATSLVKFRNRLGIEGMKLVEEVVARSWGEHGLVKTKRGLVDTTSQPKNIAYPTDADLLHKVREKISKKVKEVCKEVAFRKPFRSFSRSGKKVLLHVKKLYRNKPEARQEALKEIKSMSAQVVRQSAKMVNSLYARGRKELARELNRLVSVGKRVVAQTEEILAGEKPAKRMYSLHEPKVAAIKKGKAHPSCEFGSVVSLAINEDGLILSHEEYQENVADVKTLAPLIRGIERTTGQNPQEVAADRGFDQSQEQQERMRRRLKLKRLSIPKKGKKPHPESEQAWFKRGQRQRAKIEPLIGHLKNDHRLNRCRYKGSQGDTTNVVWSTLAWNTKKISRLARQKEQKRTTRRTKRAA